MGKTKDLARKAGKAKREASLNRIRRLLAGSTLAPAIDYERFNVAGLDLKGQRNSGFGETGFGVSGRFKVNVGNLVAPGVFRAAAGVLLSLQGAPRVLLVVQRDARRICTSRVTSAKTPEDWLNPKPVSLHLLEGLSFEGAVGADAGITLGVGNALDADENGVAMGARVDVGAWVHRVDLEGRRPQYFVGAHDGLLREEFDALVNNRIKQSIALFLAAWTRETDAKTAVLTFAGDLPEGPLDARLEQMLSASTAEGMRERLDAWDLGWSTDFGWIIRNLNRFCVTRNLKSKELQKMLDRVKAEIDNMLAKNDDRIREMREIVATGKNSDGTTLTDGQFTTAMREVEAWEQAIELAANLDAASEVLRRRIYAKQNGVARGAKSTDANTKKVRTPTQLRGTTLRGEASAAAGGKLTLDVSGVAGYTSGAKVELSGAAEVCEFFYESTSGKCLATHGGPGTDTPKRITSREHTTIRKIAVTFDHDVLQRVHGFAGRGTHEATTRGSKELYGTMVYRSVRFCRFEGESSVLPNGSGVSMGLSVRVKRLAAYAEACRGVQAGQSLSEAAEKVEKLLIDRLCVDASTLRGFFAEAWFEGLSDDVAVLVEANFQLQSERMPFKAETWFDLLSSTPATGRFEQKTPDRYPAVGNGETRLQALRLRLRQTEAARKQRTIFGLGSMGPMGGDYRVKTGREGWGISLFRSYAGGFENTIDLHTTFFGEGADDLNANPAFGFEYTVVPVALFTF